MSLIPSSSIVLICSNQKTVDRLAADECIHNRGDVRDCNAPIKKVIRLD